MTRASSGASGGGTFYLLGSAGLLVTALYFGQKILIPLALAVLLSFVLAPFVSRLERRGLRRLSAVLLGLAGWSIASQLTALIGDLPRYKADVREKIAHLQGTGKQGLLGTVQDFLDEVEKASQPRSAARTPVVRVRPEQPSLFAQLQAVVNQFLGVLTAALVVVLLVIALLIHREDLRNRIIRLAGLAVLLGSRPALGPEVRFYQRLLARDPYEAEAVVKEYLADHSLEQLFDDVLVPALVLVRRSRRSDALRPDDEQFILQSMGELVDRLAQGGGSTEATSQVLGLPACDAVDEAALKMLRQLARRAGHDVVLTGGESSLSGLVSLEPQRPVAVLMISVAPVGLTQARYLCRRLRAQAKELKIVVSRLGQRREPRKFRKLLLAAGADRVVTTLREACAQLEPLSRWRSQETAVRHSG